MRTGCDGRAAVAVVLAGWLLVCGCRPARLRPELPAELPPAERLLQILAARREAVASVRGFAEIAYENGDENLGSRHAVLARRPDRFRLEVLSPFGALAVVASDGRELVVYARRENRIYRGPAGPGSLGVYAAVPLTVEDAVAILLGTPPERPPAGAATVTGDETTRRIHLTVPLASGRQEVWFAPDTLYPVASETALPDGRTLHVDFGDYRPLGTGAFPYSIDVRAEPGERAVRVRYGAPTLNAQIADALFSFPPRVGVEELTIEQYPAGGPQS